MKILITGVAGFIGSNLADRLLADGHEVTGIDNFSTGRKVFLNEAQRYGRFRLVIGDLLDGPRVEDAVAGSDLVIHLAANADVRFGVNNPTRDLVQNTVATSRVLEAMRKAGVRKIAFASTGSVYGEACVFPTPEDAPFPIQTSLYGASKLAAEGLIQAYCEGFGFQAWILRFVSILGERYTHGHIIDFYQQLRANPGELRVLGNGSQRKSYLYVQDCIDGILAAVENANARVNIFNLGTDEYCQVKDSVRWIVEYLNVAPRIVYGNEDRGWVGDNPFIFLDCSRIRALRWTPKRGIRDAVLQTIRYLDKEAPLSISSAAARELETC